jgi:hypothetical protein
MELYAQATIVAILTQGALPPAGPSGHDVQSLVHRYEQAWISWRIGERIQTLQGLTHRSVLPCMNAEPAITAMSIGRRGISRRTDDRHNFMTDSILPGWTSDYWYALAVPRFIGAPNER